MKNQISLNVHETKTFPQSPTYLQTFNNKGPPVASIGTVILYSAEQSRGHIAVGHAPWFFRPCVTCPAFIATTLT